MPLDPVETRLVFAILSRHPTTAVDVADAVAKADHVRNHDLAGVFAAIADFHVACRTGLEVVRSQIDQSIADPLVINRYLRGAASMVNAIKLIAGTVAAECGPGIDRVVTCRGQLRLIPGHGGLHR